MTFSGNFLSAVGRMHCAIALRIIFIRCDGVMRASAFEIMEKNSAHNGWALIESIAFLLFTILVLHSFG